MGFDALPSSGPVPVNSQKTTALFKFEVPVEAQVTFLRFIVLFRDDEPLGGEAPTFQIGAGHGVLVSVGPNSGTVTITNRDEEPVGSVSCERQPRDIFLLTITDLAENSGPWLVRVKNNDTETLRFLGFSSRHEDETLQPWLVIDEPNPAFAGAVLEFVGRQPGRDIMLRNWGTAPLIIRDVAGTRLGAEDSPIVLAKRPDRVDPHDTGLLTIDPSDVNVTGILTHFLLCNDTIVAHREMRIELEPPATIPPPPPPPPDTFCRRGCGCQEYLPPAHVGGRCTRGICGHPIGDHLPV